MAENEGETDRAITSCREEVEPLVPRSRGRLVDFTLDALARAAQDKRSLGHVHHANHYAAAAYAVLGRTQQAIDQLRIAAATGLPNYRVFSTDRHLVSLREEPAMVQLLAELAARDAAFRAEFGRR